MTHHGSSHPISKALHRSFVEYNPIYLLSAAFVLGGMWILSREAAAAGTTYGALGVSGLSEVYNLALIGAAAFLTRIGEKRSGAMLGILASLYLLDLTMHTETCVFLGAVGVGAALLWWLLFAIKLHALRLALCIEIDIRSSSFLVGCAGAFAVVPQWLPSMTRSLRTEIVSVMVGAMLVGVVLLRPTWSASRGEGDTEDIRVQRVRYGVWGLCALAITFHILYWSVMTPFAWLPVVAIVAVAPVALARRETGVWARIVAAGLVCFALNGSWIVFGTISALLLECVAFRVERNTTESDTSDHPYRVFSPGVPPRSAWAPADDIARARLRTGAWACLGVAFIALDLRGDGNLGVLSLLSIASVGTVQAIRVRSPWVSLPFFPLAILWAIGKGYLSAATKAAVVGGGATALGFCLLGLGLALSVRQSRRRRVDADAKRPQAASA